jgi:predicted NAD/FAD-binding protein
MKIAIIGAGVSGLSAAYYLLRQCQREQKPLPQITIFESAPYMGGAALTFPVQIGDETRWADMGVNDFNHATYPALVELLDEFGVESKPLSDTTSFFTLDSTFSYTIDGQWNTPMPPALQSEYDRFQNEAPKDFVTDSQYRDYTVEQYLEAKGYSKDFARYNIYPRINGMYFSHETTPASMPMRGVMHYYILQEGFGTGKAPDRRYFVGGSGAWIQALASAVEKSGCVSFVGGVSAQVFADSDGVTVRTPEGDERFETCIIGCHADHALKVLRGGVTTDMLNVLSQFEYCNSIAVAHTYTPLLPQDKSAWRTYNILIHDYFEQLRPYTISYVINWHQNDAENPEYNRFNDPNYFVTLNPSVPIPDHYVLNVVGCAARPAIAYFPHNVVTLNAMSAQEDLKHVQGQNNVFFVGGWTNGAGLQQECLVASEAVAKQIVSGQPHNAEFYNSHPEAEHYAPKYLRDAVL